MKLQGKKYATLVAQDVEDLEYFVPLMRLQEEGAEVLTAALDLKPIHGKNGMPITPDTLIDSLNPGELSGLIVPGGFAPDKLRRHESVKKLVKAIFDAGKPLGIICHGGSIAISAGIVRGRRVTGSLGIKDDLINAGGIWVDEPAFRDGSMVWGRIVADIPYFCRELVLLFADMK